MSRIFLAVAICMLGAAVLRADDVPSSEAVEAFDSWAKACSRFTSDENDEGYQHLLQMEDADLLFLRGLHHTTDPVRRLSAIALSKLKTDRTFLSLVEGMRQDDMFAREESLRALTKFREPRCVAPIVLMLHSDPKAQLRKGAAYALREYDSKESVAALMHALGDESNWVATMAAYSLGVLQFPEAVEPTYELVLKVDKPNVSEGGALAGLTIHKNKKAVGHLIYLMGFLPEKHGAHGNELARVVDARILRYAELTTQQLGPVPDTVEQWREWWTQANILFDESMALAKNAEPQRTYTDAAFGTELTHLVLSTSVNPPSYRLGDPIRLDIAFRNTSSKPFRIVFPNAPSGWHPTMGWGIKLSRTGSDPVVILDIKPSGLYLGSYSGPPGFKDLYPRECFQDSICLQYWLKHQRIWPLSEGTYELTVCFDSSQFPGIKAKGPERTGLWVSSPVQFNIQGSVRNDPESLLEHIGQVTNKKWLRTDLTSRRGSRKQEAWWTVYEYGDSRLVPLLEKLAGQDAIEDNLLRGNLRKFSTGSRSSGSGQQEDYPLQSELKQSLTPEKVTEEIASLRKLIIPPKGESKADVDAVFGVPKEIKELKGKGSRVHYPMHTYQLLPPKGKLNFRAFLYVTYRTGKVSYIGINHICVKKSGKVYVQGSPQQIEQRKEIEAENIRVLADLIEIRKKYESKLKDASWNK